MKFAKNIPSVEKGELYSILALAFAMVLIIWCLFFRRFNIIKEYDEFGYSTWKEKNNRKRKTLINMALKRRKLGELPPAYPDSWYAILESDDLERGQLKEVYVLGQNLVAWRGEDSGTVFVSDAYCPHLGAHLGVGGSVAGDCIECPFHKWSFKGDSGKVQDIPYASIDVKNMAKVKGLRMWQVVEANGYVYMWHHANKELPTWYPETIVDATSGKWKFHGRSEFQVTCHIQEIPENGADIAHLNALHDAPALFGNRLQSLNSIVGRIVKHKWSADWNVSKESGRGHESLLNITHQISIFEGWINFGRVDVVVRQIGAGIVVMHFFTPFGQGILFQSVTPLEPMLQKITHRLYSKSRLFHPFALLVLQSETIQISRDIEIWNRKCFLRQPFLVKEDNKIVQFRRWFSQFYSDTNGQKKCTKF